MLKNPILIFSCTIFGRKKATELLVRITMMGNHSDWVATTLLQHMVNGAQFSMVIGDDKIGPHVNIIG
jgi:hypothetical protein